MYGSDYGIHAPTSMAIYYAHWISISVILKYLSGLVLVGYRTSENFHHSQQRTTRSKLYCGRMTRRLHKCSESEVGSSTADPRSSPPAQHNCVGKDLLCLYTDCQVLSVTCYCLTLSPAVNPRPSLAPTSRTIVPTSNFSILNAAIILDTLASRKSWKCEQYGGAVCRLQPPLPFAAEEAAASIY
jgi:hypothetical protein